MPYVYSKFARTRLFVMGPVREQRLHEGHRYEKSDVIHARNSDYMTESGLYIRDGRKEYSGSSN